MPLITLPDGNTIEFPNKVTGLEVAEKISKSLSKQATIISVNEELKDLSFVIDEDCSVKIFTSKDKEGLETIRHDTAHITAMAVQELFPGTQVTIGPIIENGFYYDFSRKEPFTEDDLNKIENKMKEIVDRDVPTTREVWKRDKAISHFKDKGEVYKAEIIESIPQGEDVSIYFHGDWHDLCRGPHLSSTGKIGKYFKLTKVSGAYWRGDSNNEMLQRIYGTSWASQKDLDEYLKRIEEAEKRDHRKLGKEMDLFHFREESPGSVFWHEKGWKLFQKLVAYMRARQEKAGYKEVNTPEILDRSLWEKSGHWEKYGEHMYTSQTPDEKIFAIKPMNCPGHVQVFNQGLKSYRDLPLRISEFGKVHRYEPSGALHGLLRVRAFTQDDAHIFCTQDQLDTEFKKVIDLVLYVFKALDFTEFTAQISLRDKEDRSKYIGSEENWGKAEAAIINATAQKDLNTVIEYNEAAFYGPKLDFMIKDALGRSWQLGTIQVDYNLPERFELEYTGSDNQPHRPVMIHRAPFGSMERFMSILIEHTAGKFPLWLTPDQFALLPISDKYNDLCEQIKLQLAKHDIRGYVDHRAESIGRKIRDTEINKIPLMMVVGDKEAESNTLSVRKQGDGDIGAMSLDEFVTYFQRLVDTE